jgi:dTDP-4-amino-4,6-dideoxygalactose transaminase
MAADPPTGPRLDIDLSAPEPIPDAGIERAVALMRTGKLFRYGEDRSGLPEAAALEAEFAEYLGRRYVIGLNSCGCALFVALKSAGVAPGDKVLMNAFTLGPVPGAVAHAGAEHVLVEITEDMTIDLADLEHKARASGARFLLLSHMRGHICDMDALIELCCRLGVTVIEDCAHTMGAKWNGRFTGTFGAAGCFSLQTFKHMNAGEGGLLATDDEDIAAKAILHSGSYMLYGQHKARPPLEAFERHKYTTPNFSMRMSNLVAAVARPQIGLLAERAGKWNERYAWLAEDLGRHQNIRLPRRPPKEEYVASSIQFMVNGLSPEEMNRFLAESDSRGVHIKWFGRPEPVGFTSVHEHWRYMPQRQNLPHTAAVLARLCDMRIPVTLSRADCRAIAAIVGNAIDAARGA